MEEPKPARGRPKVPWDAFDNEFWRRITNGEACETVTDEAKHLAKWAKGQGICTSHGTYLKYERIRDRLRNRYNGAAGYKKIRLRMLDEFINKLKERN